jgi:indolepyruvate ferredoxin oxidoreductase, beta subunit
LREESEREEVPQGGEPQEGVTNIVLSGVGGQGVVTASEILAMAALQAGHDVKKSELRGMSQRGGAVTSNVRFGPRILSPMVPRQQAHYLLLLSPEQLPQQQHRLHPQGQILQPDLLPLDQLPHRRSANVALLGLLSQQIDSINEEHWLQAIQETLSPRLHKANLAAFQLGRQTG